MLGIIISCHGGFATGIEKASSQHKHKPPPLTFLLTLPIAQLRQALSIVDSGYGIVLLTDILGGTPFRMASNLTISHGKAEVIAGCNLQLPLETMIEREMMTIGEFRQFSIAAGKRGLPSLDAELKQRYHDQYI